MKTNKPTLYYLLNGDGFWECLGHFDSSGEAWDVAATSSPMGEIPWVVDKVRLLDICIGTLQILTEDKCLNYEDSYQKDLKKFYNKRRSK